MKKQLINSIRFFAVCGIFISLNVSAIAEPNPFSVSGYGVTHYSHFDWEIDPGRRAAIDIERFVVAPKYRINDTIRLESENGHTNFLHDGRARDLMEAILWHGGEAETSRQTVEQMSKAERDALIAFLESL